MVLVIKHPHIIQAAGTPAKNIEEFFGSQVSGSDKLSLARMNSPAGWNEPWQAPEFDEFTLVLSGELQVETKEGISVIQAGQSVMVPRGMRVKYSTPSGAEYIAVCLPAFTPERVFREDERETSDHAITPETISGDEDSNDSLIYRQYRSEGLDLIEDLWLMQREHHAQTSIHFSEQIQNRTFKERKEEILKNNWDRFLSVIIVTDSKTGENIGFCISSGKTGEYGEIESLYVKPSTRKCGIGKNLMNKAFAWMDNMDVKGYRVLVSSGNEQVLPFYEKFGFFPRHHYLIRMKEQT